MAVCLAADSTVPNNIFSVLLQTILKYEIVRRIYYQQYKTEYIFLCKSTIGRELHKKENLSAPHAQGNLGKGRLQNLANFTTDDIRR